MTSKIEKPAASFFRASIPTAYILRGSAFVGSYLLLDFIGLRKYTSILSGTLPSTGCSFFTAKCMATLYLSFYLFAYLLAPIYFISGALQALFTSLVDRSDRGR